MALNFTDQTAREAIESGKTVVIDFWATWCGPCMKLGPVVEELAEKYGDKAIIGKLNVDENDEIPVEENTVGVDEIKQELYINAKNILEENDYSFAKDIIKDSEVINGNTFLCGETVELKNVTINGDLFVTASKLKISNEANLNGNVFIFAGNVEFDGKVAREMFAFVKDMVFGENATVMYNVNIAADHISLNGTCYRSVNVTVENMEVKDKTVVLGNLNYVSEKEAVISESAVITNTNFSKYVEEKKQVIDIVVEKVLDFSRYFILVMAVFIVIMKYLPTVIENLKRTCQ